MHVPVSDQARRSARRVAAAVADADALLITAGAGMSVESGLPDFRSPQGLWHAYPVLEPLGLSFEQLAQPQWFAHQPEMAWAWYGHRQQLYRAAEPHAGYRMLHEWAQAMPAGAFVVTTNVDGQFVAAGFAEDALLEQHGSVHRLQCTTPCSDRSWDAGELALDIDLPALQARGALPRCPACGALARPNVLMFNDVTWVDAVRREQQRRFEHWLDGVRGRRVVIVECGAGTAIPTIRRIGERVAERSRTTLVRINPDATEADEPTLVLRLPALQALALVDAALPEAFRHRGTPAAPAEPPLELPPGRRIRLSIGQVTCVDLGRGLLTPLDPQAITDDDMSAALERLVEAQRDWTALPAVGGRTLAGYTMRAGIIRTPGDDAGGASGNGVVFIQDPGALAVMTLGLARRASDGAFMWQFLYETAARPLAALDHPRVPWVARRPETDLARYAADLPLLGAIERALAWGWFHFMAFREATRPGQGAG